MDGQTCPDTPGMGPHAMHAGSLSLHSLRPLPQQTRKLSEHAAWGHLLAHHAALLAHAALVVVVAALVCRAQSTSSGPY